MEMESQNPSMNKMSPKKRHDGALARCMPGVSLSNSGTKLRKRSTGGGFTSQDPSPSRRFSLLSRSESIANGVGRHLSVRSSLLGTGTRYKAPNGADLVWQGFGLSPLQWEGFAKDEDMWIPSGDSLVFFEEAEMRNPPTPYCRLDADIVAQSGIPFLVALLSAGKLESSQQARPRYPGMSRVSPIAPEKRRSLGLLPVMRSFSPLKLPGLEQPVSKRSSWLSHSDKRKTWMGSDTRWWDYPQTEPASLDLVRDIDNVAITHEIWFSLPRAGTEKGMHYRKLAVRNVLAMVYDKAVVGQDLFHLLRDVHDVLMTFGATPERDSANEATAFVTKYLRSRKLDDPRNNLGIALSLLAWAEQPNVNWQQGYLESFVHAAGMMTANTVTLGTYRRLSDVTKHNLQNAHSAMHLVTQEVEEKLNEFDFTEMFKLQGALSSPARRSFDAFTVFLQNFYVAQYGKWPPTKDRKSVHWLDRDIVRRLQDDFGALYDALVDTSLYWENLRASYRRDWEIVCTDPQSDFVPDLPNLPVTDILVGWDNHHGLPHIPCPFPLLPENEQRTKRKPSSLFSSLRKREAAVQSEKEKLGLSILYSSATNITRHTIVKEGKILLRPAYCALCSHITAKNVLVEAFQEHERTAEVEHLTLREARLGRWLLLYGVLQVLSHLSVDVQSLAYTDDVHYFLCASLSGCPAWTRSGWQTRIEEASPFLSHCWTLLDRLDESPIIVSNASGNERSLSLQHVSLWDKSLQTPTEEHSEQPQSGGQSPSADHQGLDTSAYDKAERKRPMSDGTAVSAWTDVHTISDGRPSMSTVLGDHAEAVQYQQRSSATVARGSSEGDNDTT